MAITMNAVIYLWNYLRNIINKNYCEESPLFTEDTFTGQTNAGRKNEKEREREREKAVNRITRFSCNGGEGEPRSLEAKEVIMLQMTSAYWRN